MKLKDAGHQFYVWAAVDVKTKELLAIRASWHRSEASWMQTFSLGSF
ncbi:MAG: hypothetical protein QW220_02480 [Candidatus Bathyarchaeia archaeon]